MRRYLVKYSYTCYALITLGQLWLYSLKLRTGGLFERVTLNPEEWIGSHIILLLGAVLVIPVTLVLKNYLKGKARYLVLAAIVFTFLGTTALVGQYILDFYLVPLFGDQTSKSAYESLDLIQSSDFIKFFCYDLIAAWLLGQILFIIALSRKKGYPRWAIGIFISGILMLIFGDNLHELVERLSYLLISIALWPVFKLKG